MIPEIFGPLLARFLVGIKLQVQQDVLLAAAADDVNVFGKVLIMRHQHGWFPQNIGPQPTIQIAIAEMVGAVQVSSQQ